MMEYCYDINEKDSFYTNWNVNYLFYDNKIIGIKRIYNENITTITGLQMNTFDCNTKNFTSTEELQKVEYNDLKQVSCYYIYLTYMFLIDVDNKQYTETKSFPFMIYEIDGNNVESCRNNDTIYIFHSRTETYETGILIYDIKSNQFNHKDYQDIERQALTQNDNDDDSSETMDEYYDRTIKHTNKFSNLHKKTIASCSMYNDTIYILWHGRDDIDDDLKLSKYDPVNDKFTDIMKPLPTYIWYKDLNIANNKAYIRGYGDNLIYVYDLNSYELLEKIKIHDEEDMCLYWFVNDSSQVFICEKYKNPFGQIWKDNHDDEFKTRNLKIIKLLNNAILKK